MPRGGARPGAGRKKGYKEQGTLAKEEARALLRQIVTKNMQPMIEAQIANAQGLKYLIARDKTSGKFRRLAEADMAMAGDSEREVIEVWEKDPNVSAFTDLLNRTLDKPTEHVEMDGTLKGGLTFRWEK
jgi:hypothetical protein